jgi:hypothetical protein
MYEELPKRLGRSTLIEIDSAVTNRTDKPDGATDRPCTLTV